MAGQQSQVFKVNPGSKAPCLMFPEINLCRCARVERLVESVVVVQVEVAPNRFSAIQTLSYSFR